MKDEASMQAGTASFPGIPLEHLQGRRVAVSGASGFIGRHLVATLHRLGAEITMLRRPGSSTSPFTPIRSHVVDFASAEGCAAALKRLRPEAVVHLAGFVSGDRSLSAVSVALRSNLEYSSNLMLGALDSDPSMRVVVASTLDITDPWKGALQLGSPYGVSKAMVEVLSGSLRTQYGANFVNARIGLCYGPDDPNDHRLIPSVIESLLDGRSPRLSSGTRRADWVFIDDVVEALIRMATAPRMPVAGLDIGTGMLTSVRGVAERIRDLLRSPLDLSYSAELNRANEQEHVADIGQMHEVLGWHPQTTLDEGLMRTIAWRRRVRGQAVGKLRMPPPLSGSMASQVRRHGQRVAAS